MRITLKISFRLIQVKLNSRRWNETNFAAYNNPFFLILLHHFRKMLRIFHKICFQLFYSKKKYLIQLNIITSVDKLITPDFYLKELILIYFDVAKLN